MTIEVKAEKLQNLENSSQLIENIRQQLVHMNTGVIADIQKNTDQHDYQVFVNIF